MTGEGVATAEEEEEQEKVVVRRPDLIRRPDGEPEGSFVSGLTELSPSEVRDNAGEAGDKADESAARNSRTWDEPLIGLWTELNHLTLKE